MKTGWLSLLSLATLVSSEDDIYNDPQYHARLEHFKIETQSSAVSKFTCKDLGARCVFVRDDYADVHFGGGQETENEQGAVWAATTKEAVLTLGSCQTNSCTVTCNANCTCAFTTNDNAIPQKCEEASKPAPIDVTNTVPPKTQMCPKSVFTEHCPQLMQTAVPPGNFNGQFDCFNFCGGAWVSTCDYAGNCGPLDCQNKTTAGTYHGLVQGCTVADLPAQGTGSGAIGWTMLTTAILMVLSMVV